MEKALHWKTRAAENRNLIAQRYLAAHYSHEKDNEKAFEWYLKAAEQGDSDSMMDIALMYASGTGTEQNTIEALKWIIIAAKKGLPRAIEERASLSTQYTKKQIDAAMELAQIRLNAPWRVTQTFN